MPSFREMLKNPRLQWSFAIGLLLVLLSTIVRNAWLSDDCYITFRTVWNFLHGLGLRWNPGERVQTFTHPLWMFLLIPVYAVTGKAWLTAWIAGIGCTLVALVLLVRKSHSPALAIFGMLLLLSSRAFTDFASSGLENPLSWLLLAILLGKATGNNSTKNALGIGILSALLLLNRLDHFTLLFPFLLSYFLKLDLREKGKLLLGFLPLFLWLAFATIYFGLPLPNTFYAKAVTGHPRSRLIEQGLLYFLDALQQDPLLIPVILAGILLPVFAPMRKFWPFALGLILNLAYVIWVGGDFMSGRFFVNALFMSVLLLTRWEGNLSWKLSLAGLGLCIALLFPYHPLKTGKHYYEDRAGNEEKIYASGIVDEKGMAWKRSSLYGFGKHKEVKKLERELAGKSSTYQPDSTKLQFQVAVGMRGYTCGPNVHILDKLALTDPLLAQLPARQDSWWRIGHFLRWVPWGYPQTILSGKNEIGDPELRLFWEDMELLSRAPLWTKARWKAIFRVNLGISQKHIDRDFYSFPPEDAREGRI